ncbi:MAG: ABC transporter permease subunit [Acidimicrobiia bacterium]|nr:ABC transporter permease subunit [Acidimicrobiia bacterium]
MWAMITKEMRQMRRDRRTLAMMIVMPVMLLVVFGYAASFDVATINVAVTGQEGSAVGSMLPEPFHLIESSRTDPEEILRHNDADVAISVSGGEATAYIDGAELFTARAAVQAFTAAAEQGVPVTMEVLFNPELATSAVLVPGLAGLVLLFIGSLVTSLGVVRERQTGTLEQLAVMPFTARDVFVGKIGPYFVVAAIDLVVVLAVGRLLFDVPFRGSIALLSLGALLFLFVTLGTGVLISMVSQNQGQAIQLALMTLLPQVLLSGIIFPLESMAAGVRWIGYLLPLTYFNQIARGVMLRGAPLSAVALPLSLLAILGVVVFGLAVLAFRRQLAPAKTVPA